MGSFTIHNIDDHLKQRLQHQAAKHGVSAEEESLRILRLGIHLQEMQDAREASAKQIAAWEREDAGKPKRGMGTEIHDRFKGCGIADLEFRPKSKVDRMVEDRLRDYDNTGH